MASLLISTSPSPVASDLTLRLKATGRQPTCSVTINRVPLMGGRLRLVHKVRLRKATRGSSSPLLNRFNTTISCSIAPPETLQAVQSTIAKQLSIDECTVTPQTKFADLGADSLDTVEIMMALEEKFGVSIGDGGAENVATVQDAADLIEKVKSQSAAS